MKFTLIKYVDIKKMKKKKKNCCKILRPKNTSIQIRSEFQLRNKFKWIRSHNREKRRKHTDYWSTGNKLDNSEGY